MKKTTSMVLDKRQDRYVEKEGTIQPFHEGVELFNIGRKWWLRYSYQRMTGSFPTKKKAMAWWEDGGR